MIDIILKYFPILTDAQKSQFEQMATLYPEWNKKINVISRKDIDNIQTNHILHSLALAKFIKFKSGTKILDLGTGGGFPGIPLAVMFPDVHLHLIDRIGKKIMVAQEIAAALGLNNVSFQHGDSGECHEKFDFIVSRAVMPQPDLVRMVRKNVSAHHLNAIPNGILTLKGGDLDAEIKPIKSETEVVEIGNYFNEEYFKTKKIVYTSLAVN